MKRNSGPLTEHESRQISSLWFDEGEEVSDIVPKDEADALTMLAWHWGYLAGVDGGPKTAPKKSGGVQLERIAKKLGVLKQYREEYRVGYEMARGNRNPELIWGGEDGDEIDEDPWQFADEQGVNVLSHLDFHGGYVNDDGELIGVLFTGISGDDYEFDLAVRPDYRRQGLASELMDIAISDYEEHLEWNPDLVFSLDVISPISRHMLEKRGFRVVGGTPDRPMMTRNPKDLSEALPETRRELWDDGTLVVFGASPFPVERKPWVSAKALESAEVTEIPLDTVRASQSEVTWHGVERYLPRKTDVPYHDLPIVLFEDGVNYIQDGHHRLVAALLRGDRTVLVRQVDVIAATQNPEPIIIVGIGPDNRWLISDSVIPAMEEFPALEPLIEQIYDRNFELYDMAQLPEKGDALDAVTEHTPLVIVHHIYGIHPFDTYKARSGKMYNQRNELWLPLTRDLGVPMLVIGDQPTSADVSVGLYNVARENPLPPMAAFLEAAQDVLDSDWSGRGFVGRDELVAAVLERLNYGECAVAGDAAERALTAVVGREP